MYINNNKLCLFYVNGRCLKKNKCPFKHFFINYNCKNLKNPDIFSKRQILYLWINKKYIKSFLTMLLKNYQLDKLLYSYALNLVASEIISYLNNNFNDFIIYKNIKKLLEINFSKYKINRDIMRNIQHINQIKNLLPEKISINKYVDIGCGNGHITNEIRKYLNIEKEKCFGCDILDKNLIINDNFIYYNTKSLYNLPFEDNSIDLITCFVSMHHFRDINRSIKELNRIIKKNGYLMIREHDCNEKIYLPVFLDVVHAVNTFVLNENYNNDFFYNNWYSSYKSQNEWQRLLNNHGFKSIKYNYINNKNSQNLYHELFKKM